LLEVAWEALNTLYRLIAYMGATGVFIGIISQTMPNGR
jgi:hypothetical protein